MGGKASIIEGLIKAIGAEAPAAKKAAKPFFEHGSPERDAALDAFYGGTHPNYRQRYFTGTSKDKDFTAFQESRHGTWLTNNPSEASDYALQNDSQNLRLIPGTWKYESVNSASRVLPTHARVENPYTGELPDFARAENYKKAQSDWFDTLRAQGYDAWAPDSRKGDLVVVLKDQGTNVKSATGNAGTFDRSKKHLNYASGGIVEGIRALHGDLPERPQFGQDTAMRQMFMDRQIDDDLRSAGISPQAQPKPQPPVEDIFAGANSPFADPGYTPPAATPSAIGAAAPQRDMPQNPAFGDDTRMRQMYLNRQIDADMAGMQRPSEPRRPSGGMSYAPELPAPPPPRMDDSGVRRPVAAYREPEAQIPIPRARPRPESYAIREGDNPSKIAAMFGMSLKQLEKKNPGILKRSKRLKVGSEVVI